MSNTIFFKIINLCTVVCMSLLLTTCEDPQGTGQDTTPPAQPAEVGEITALDNTIDIPIGNPNDESINVLIVLVPDAPGAVFTIDGKTFTSTDGAPIVAGANATIQISGLENDIEYSVTVTTRDSAGNSNDAPTTTQQTPRQTYPFICENGTPEAGTSITNNTNNCARCIRGYELFGTACELITYPHVCRNGQPEGGREPVPNIELCESCDSGYLPPDDNNLCQTPTRYTCENGTASPGNPGGNMDVIQCAMCSTGYYRSPANLCLVAGSYTCENGTVQGGHPSGPSDVEFCSSCNSGYLIENNLCRLTAYTCENGTERSGTPGGNADVEFCTNCSSGYYVNTNNVCVAVGDAGAACSANNQCADNLRCDTTTIDGDPISNTCEVLLASGSACNIHSQCTDGFCGGASGSTVCTDGSVGSVCSNFLQCDTGLFCHVNQCSDRNVGSVCNSDTHCNTGLSCIVNLCSDMSAGNACSADNHCDSELSCILNLCSDMSLGSACSSNTHCRTRSLCILDVCSDKSPGSACSTDDHCTIYCENSLCVDIYEAMYGTWNISYETQLYFANTRTTETVMVTSRLTFSETLTRITTDIRVVSSGENFGFRSSGTNTCSAPRFGFPNDQLEGTMSVRSCSGPFNANYYRLQVGDNTLSLQFSSTGGRFFSDDVFTRSR